MPSYGWKRDTPVHISSAEIATSAYRAERYGSYRLSLPSSHYDLMRYCHVRDQGDTSACVGFAVTGAAYARLRSLGYDCGPFSPLTAYSIGRQLEGIYKGKLLPDDGSYPFLVMDGLRKFGFAREEAWPFDRDVASRVRQEVPFDVFQQASQFRLSSFARIDVRGEGRTEACKRAIYAGHPVPLGMQVGRTFQDYSVGKDPVGIEMGDTGGHMTFLCGYEDDGEVFIGCNSWGTSWGDNGFYRITRAKLEDPSTTDLYDFIVTDRHV